MQACRPLAPACSSPGSAFVRARRWRMERPTTASAPRAATTEVAESLHLIRFPAGTTEEDAAQVVDGVWSLQYMAAGPICGSAGPLTDFRCSAAAAGCEPFTHAVLFRHSSAAGRERFEGQPRVQLMLGGTGAPEGTAISTLNFAGRVPTELEAIFRRGPEWDAGVELVAALVLQGGSSHADADEFLSLTQQLALSSAFGAVQCSYGACEGAGARPAGGAPRPDLLLLARFQEAAQLQQFLACPPVAALLEGDDRIPLACLWSCVLETQPSDSSTSRGVQGGMM